MSSIEPPLASLAGRPLAGRVRGRGCQTLLSSQREDLILLLLAGERLPPSTLKGVDRAKRDEMIDAWASKQAAMRRAMQAVPSIRDFYEPPPESPPRDRKVYAPADLR